MKIKRPIVLTIMDGWGIGNDDAHNPIFLADTPNIDHLLATYANTIIGAAGEFIGLPPGHQGSSEIGHLIIGAGRNVLLPQTQIKQATKNGDIDKNPAYLESLKKRRGENSALHIFGLLSDMGVHAYDETCHALLRLAKEKGVPDEKIFIHVITDGRDVMPKTAKTYLDRLKKVGIGRIADIQGRYWAMDRDHRWDRVEKAYNLFTSGRAEFKADDAHQAVDSAYKRGETDEFIKPTLITEGAHFQDDDVVWNFNYRVDREIEITEALIEADFKAFKRAVWPKINYVAMTDYYKGISCPVAFSREEPRNTLGEVLAGSHLTSFRCTETEKWPYLTKIFNGLREDPFPGEVRKLFPSDKVATYDEKPEMQAMKIAKEVGMHLHEKSFDVYMINFANPDILGHTGNKEAVIKGVETVDKAVGLVYEELLNRDGIMIVTADHGDAEIIYDPESGQPHTSHTDSHVPFIYVDEKNKDAALRENGALKDVAPTMLELLGIKKPEEMTGASIII